MKIPKPMRRGHAWRIQFMYGGERYSGTFDTEVEAKEWSARKILEIKDAERRQESGELPKHTLTELIDQYLIAVSVKKRGHRWESLRLTSFKRNNSALCAKNLIDIKRTDIATWRDLRARQVSDGTVLREIGLIASVFSYAIDELEWLKISPTYKVKRPRQPKARDRRISDADIDALLEATGYERGTPPLTPRHRVAWCFLFAIETAMRAGEIVGMHWSDIDGHSIHIAKTKTDRPRTIPIFDSVKPLLEAVRGLDDERVIPITSQSLDTLFRRYRDKAGLDGLHFHDTRHEAITRLVQFLDVEDTAKISGHTNIKELVLTYYNPTVQELADKVNKGRAKSA